MKEGNPTTGNFDAEAYAVREAEKAQKILSRLEGGKKYNGLVDFADGRIVYFDDQTTEQIQEKMKAYAGIGILRARFRDIAADRDISGE